MSAYFSDYQLTFAPKEENLTPRIKVAAVSYLNTKPLLYGIEKSRLINEIDLVVDYPSMLAKRLQEGSIDLALLPVAAMHGIKGAHIVSDYGIASDGNVVSVALFSHVPLADVKSVYLDYQSRTSVKLAQVLLQNYWKQKVEYKQADEHFIDSIKGDTAGVIIGDRALMCLPDFEYVYDLSAAWKAWTGLDFIFAAWVANKQLPADFLVKFNAANSFGINHFDEVIAQNPFPAYDLKTYYTKNIKYFLDEGKREGLKRFMELSA